MSVRNCILGSKRSWRLWSRNWTRCIRRQNPEFCWGESLIRHAPNRLEAFVILPIGVLSRARGKDTTESKPRSLFKPGAIMRRDIATFLARRGHLRRLRRRPISANLNFWDDCLPRRGRRTQPGVLTPGAQSIKGLALKGPKV